MKGLADEWSEIALLARTHGQPASPTRLGKEIEVFITRLEAQFKSINSIPNAAKFGGATGNFNAHKVAYPNINWQAFANEFLKDKLYINLNKSTLGHFYATYEKNSSSKINNQQALMLTLESLNLTSKTVYEFKYHKYDFNP